MELAIKHIQSLRAYKIKASGMKEPVIITEKFLEALKPNATVKVEVPKE